MVWAGRDLRNHRIPTPRSFRAELSTFWKPEQVTNHILRCEILVKISCTITACCSPASTRHKFHRLLPFPRLRLCTSGFSPLGRSINFYFPLLTKPRGWGLFFSRQLCLVTPPSPPGSCSVFPGAVVTQCAVAGASPGVPAEGPRLLFASGLTLLIFIVKLKVKKK